MSPDGANFALFSEHSEAVELCLFDSPCQRRPTQVLPLASRTGGVFHARIAGIKAGQIYGYRVRGPWDPAAGHRFDPCKVLLDPYARAIARPPKWGPEVYSYRSDTYPNPAALDQAGSNLDSGDCSPLGIVVDTAPPPSAASRPGTSWRDTLIYELHVRGMTKLHPEVDPGLRGTYAGLASEPVLEHLRSLGVSAVELLPVQHFVDDHRLAKLGLTNYWGYQPLGYFAPEPRYAAATGAAVAQEFRDMVERFHQAGIEVILDVVYNHTAEQGHDGPTLSFRGIDNASYYRLEPGDRRRYVDYTGCGNTLNTQHPAVVRLVMDSLRYWVEAMGVDGFRFDLAAVIGRTERGFDRRAPLLAAISQDPVLRSVKLIAEPWDLNSHDSMQLGNFPSDWAEWNLRFRDETRCFWRGDAHMVPRLASRLAGSSDVFGLRRRSPQSSVNFVASHDGFTLADLVSYTRKLNSANGEGNVTESRTTTAGTAAQRARLKTEKYWPCVSGSGAICSQPCFYRKVCRCSRPATSSDAHSRETTTPTARTISSAGSTGPRRTAVRSWNSRGIWPRSVGTNQPCGERASSKGSRILKPGSKM